MRDNTNDQYWQREHLHDKLGPQASQALRKHHWNLCYFEEEGYSIGGSFLPPTIQVMMITPRAVQYGTTIVYEKLSVG